MSLPIAPLNAVRVERITADDNYAYARHDNAYRQQTR